MKISIKSSDENFLDGLGALVGTTRIPASAARAVMQIKLSAERETETIIPAGTRISPEKNIYFAIVSDVVIPAGETSAQVTAICTETGEIGNGYAEGEIKEIVDPVAYVASIVNISKSAGGSDTEKDDSLRERILAQSQILWDRLFALLSKRDISMSFRKKYSSSG